MTRFALIAALVTACVNPPKFNGIEDRADAGGADAAPETGTSTVHATMRNGSDSPQVGAHVVFTDPSGAITFAGDTDGTGLATGPVVEGGNLFVAYDAPSVLVVVTNIHPGETYELGQPRYGFLPRMPTATMTVTRYTNSTYYVGASRCGSGAMSVGAGTAPVTMPFTWTEGCVSNEMVGVMAYGTDSDGTPIVSKYTEVPYPAVAINNQGAYSAPKPVTFTLTEPTDLKFVSVAVSAVDHDYLFGGGETQTIMNLSTTVTSSYFPAAPTAPLLLSTALTGNGTGIVGYVASLAAGTTAVTADFTLSARPQFWSKVIVPPLRTDPVTWMATEGQLPTLAVLDVTLVRASTPTTSLIRYIFEPGTTPTFSRPAIPDVAAFAAFQPVDGEATTVVFRAVRFLNGMTYAQFRTLADHTMFYGGKLPQQLLALPGVDAAFVTTSQ